MKTISKIFQYLYLIVAAILLFEAFMDYKANGTRYWLYILFAIAAVFMFFFKKHFNKKMENRNNQKP